MSVAEYMRYLNYLRVENFSAHTLRAYTVDLDMF